MEIINGTITNIGPGRIEISVPYPNTGRALLREYSTVQVGFPDGRTITPEQRAKAYAMMRDISDWTGHAPDFIKRLMKLDFITNRLDALVKDAFSLSNCDVTLAREYITFLIDFCIEHGVPCRIPLYEQAEDISRYVYACLKHKKCAVCGIDKVDLHHWDSVGRRNRDNVYQIGWPVISLCREHHNEFHDKGGTVFAEKYHLEPIPLTEEIGRIYKLTRKNLIKE